ncbi:MAG: transporter substrate-binding domain-containing protein, partial [Spirochaetales bacterium]|nr:transporter substrate-binding domain-containing protein [Spirochaetales bacterium]
PVLRVAADYDFSPYSFYDSNNQVTGLDVEVINEIANRLGMKAEITFTDWISCKNLLQTKDTDLIMGLEIFSNLQGVLKTTAVSSDQLLVFGKTTINDIAALKGKKVGLITNSVIEKIYDLNCEYIPYYTNTQVLESIEEGKVDYGICHGSVAKKILEKTGYDIFPSISLMNSYPAIGVRDDLPELREQINNILIQLSNEGFLKKLDEKWLMKYSNKVTVLGLIRSEARIFTIYFILFFASICIAIFLMQDSYRKEMLMKNTLKYQASLKQQNDMLTSIAKVYYTMHAINLKENTVKEIQTSDQVKQYVNKTENAVFQMQEVMKNTVIPEDVEIALNFTDLTTLPQRMGNKKSMLAEFRGTQVGWFCAQFIAMNHNEKGEVTDVIFTTQSIDEMKKEKEHLLQISRHDELTRLLNRHAYDTKIEELKESKINKLTAIVLDVNSLKATNDNIGHHAGDELICGAADCIRDSFSSIGSCYRTGGDEFLVLIEGETTDIDSLINDFRNQVSQWKGKIIEKLSLSIGFASFSEIEGFTLDQINELIHIADKKMYADKAMYYKKLGIERRR